MRRPPLLPWVFLLLTAVSCQGSGDRTLDQVDPTAVAADPTFDEVNAIVHRSCVPCHADGNAAVSPDEGGRVLTGGAFSLENCVDIVSQRFSILDQVTDNLMPPGAWPRLTSEEKLAIRRWVENGAPAPCN